MVDENEHKLSISTKMKNDCNNLANSLDFILESKVS